MPKKAKQSVPVVNRRALSRREREARFLRSLYIGGAALLALIIGVFALGAYGQWVVEPSRPAATVNGVPIRTDTLERMSRYSKVQWSQFYDVSQIDPSIVVESALNSLIDDELVRQEAKRRNLFVAPDEVQKRIERNFGYFAVPPTPSPSPAATQTPASTPPAAVGATAAAGTPAATTATAPAGTPTAATTATPAPTPTPVTAEGFKKLYADYLKKLQTSTGLSEAEYRNLVTTDMLRSQLDEAVSEEVPTSAEQIHARHIVLEKPEDAAAALERLKKGEDFAALARELSKDEGNKEAGGDLGWLPRGKLEGLFDVAAFALQPGQLSEVVQTSSGYEIIKVEERDPNKPLDQATLSLKKSSALQEWLDKQRQDAKVVKQYPNLVQKVSKALQSGAGQTQTR